MICIYIYILDNFIFILNNLFFFLFERENKKNKNIYIFNILIIKYNIFVIIIFNSLNNF